MLQPIFAKSFNQYYSNKNNRKTITYSKPSALNTNFSKASVDNYKANYMVNFRGRISYEISDSSGIGTFNHQTAFFREPVTDEIVQNYILENFAGDKEINIVSGACSSGEEAKSYAMLLDNLSNIKIMGFDISSESVQEARNNTCQLIANDDDAHENLVDLDSENILLTDNADSLTEYERKCRQKFKQYYQPEGLPYKVPVFPNAKQELENFEALLADKEEFEKQKKQYNMQMQILKNTAPELAEYMPDISFEDSIDVGKRMLEQRVESYKTVVDFKTEENSFNNCVFTQGDVMNLEHLYEPGSINVLLYRNALYHTLCEGNDMLRRMKDDSPETMNLIAKQMNKILKINGLVVFGEDEYMQGIDTNIIKEAMENNGFKMLQENSNIWVKTENI